MATDYLSSVTAPLGSRERTKQLIQSSTLAAQEAARVAGLGKFLPGAVVEGDNIRTTDIGQQFLRGESPQVVTKPIAPVASPSPIMQSFSPRGTGMPLTPRQRLEQNLMDAYKAPSQTSEFNRLQQEKLGGLKAKIGTFDEEIGKARDLLSDLDRRIRGGLNREEARLAPMELITGRQAELQRQGSLERSDTQAVLESLQRGREAAEGQYGLTRQDILTELGLRQQDIDRPIELGQQELALQEKFWSEPYQLPNGALVQKNSLTGEVRGLPDTGAGGAASDSWSEPFRLATGELAQRNLVTGEIRRLGREPEGGNTGAGSETSTVSNQYTDDLSRKVLDSVEELLPRINSLSFGRGAIAQKNTPGWLEWTQSGDFRNMRADLITLSALISFKELQEMRNASKTGGALGQVAIRELELLESTLGALKQEQDPANARKNMEKIRKNILLWNVATKLGNAGIQIPGNFIENYVVSQANRNETISPEEVLSAYQSQGGTISGGNTGQTSSGLKYEIIP